MDKVVVSLQFYFDMLLFIVCCHLDCISANEFLKHMQHFAQYQQFDLYIEAVFAQTYSSIKESSGNDFGAAVAQILCDRDFQNSELY